MKIRAITFFAPLKFPTDSHTIATAADFLHNAKAQFEKTGYEVQTLRLATTPFTQILGHDATASETIAFAHWLESETQSLGIEYVSMGTVMAQTANAKLSALETIPDIIAQTESLFVTALVATSQNGINLAAIENCAHIIHRIGKTTPNGFGNLRFAMLANVAPDGPFFPGAYHIGNHPAFGIATEAADLAVSAFKNAKSLSQAQNDLTQSIARHAEKLTIVTDDLIANHRIEFSGFDFSYAPFPNTETSIGGAMEHLGVDAFGAHGTLFVTAMLTNILKQANPKPVGYNGVMLPVLEDSVLAQRSLDANYTVNDLLLYSAVCGTGLDTVPIPGDSTPDQIAGVLLDVATLSTSLNKPLTARLLPVPGLVAGDKTGFNFEFFENSAVLPLKQSASSALFLKDTFIRLKK